MSKRADELEALFESIKWADECGLLSEFLEFFLIDFKQTGNMFSAITFANREWDL